MEPLDVRLVVLADVLAFIALDQVAFAEGFESYEYAAHSRGGGLFYEVAPEYGVDGGSALEDPVHSPHAREQGTGKALVTQQVVIQKVKMTAGKPVDLGEGRIDSLGIEGAAALEKSIFVTEITMMGTAAGNDDRIWNKITCAFDKVAADRRDGLDVSFFIVVYATGIFLAEILQELRERVFTRTDEYTVGMHGGFIRQGAHMKASQAYVYAPAPVPVCNGIGPEGIGDIDLYHDDIRRIVECQFFYVLVLERNIVLRVAVGREGGETQRREEGIFDRPPKRTLRLGECRKDHLNCHGFFLVAYVLDDGVDGQQEQEQPALERDSGIEPASTVGQ